MFIDKLPETGPIQTNWDVITGGPSSGKSALIEHLSFLGHRTVPEAARVLITAEMSRGRTLKQIRADESDFQVEVFRMKADVEDRLDPYQHTIFERGRDGDTMAYWIARGSNWGADKDGRWSYPVESIISIPTRRYRSIFLLDMLKYEKDYARTETAQEALKIHSLLAWMYQLLDYKVINVPILPIPERAQFVLNEMAKLPLVAAN